MKIILFYVFLLHKENKSEFVFLRLFSLLQKYLATAVKLDSDNLLQNYNQN